MGTYAVYHLWAGVIVEKLNELDRNHPFIKKILKNYNGVKKDGLTFTTIGMHGEVIGIGVEIIKLSWKSEIDENNLLTEDISKKGKFILEKIDSIFEKLNISTCPMIYHHIDLGG